MFMIADFEKSLLLWHKARKLRDGNQEVCFCNPFLTMTLQFFVLFSILQVKEAIENIGQTIVSSMTGAYDLVSVGECYCF